MEVTRTLLERFCRDECSVEEVKEIQSWLEDGSMDNLRGKMEIPDGLCQRVWDRLHAEIYPAVRMYHHKRVREGLLKSAAVLLVIMGSLILIHYHYRNHPKPAVYITESKQEKIILPDSSVVFLSPNSVLKVLQPYGKNKRNLELTGEAVFEAKHHASAPFSVISGDIITTALGTAFKVIALPGRQDIKVAISYGKIVVREKTGTADAGSIFLEPGEEVVYNKATATLKREVAGMKQFDYKTNILYFKNSGIQEVAEKLQEYYHIKIKYNSLREVRWSVSGEFDYQPLEVVMKAIAFSCNIVYQINGDLLTIKAKN